MGGLWVDYGWIMGGLPNDMNMGGLWVVYGGLIIALNHYIVSNKI